MIINRIFAMPNNKTFTIKPIKNLIKKYINKYSPKIIIDPFANNCKYGTITNDLNPEFDTNYNLDALAFLNLFSSDYADMILYDPPYSITQASQMYKNYGKEKLDINVSNMKYWSECKNRMGKIIKPGGIIISCGWSSNGLGITRGFEILEILLVCHGASRYDTIVVTEKKIGE